MIARKKKRVHDARAISKPARAWQRMLSGRRLDLLAPSPLDIEIEDIAHGLARLARWNGQTSGNYPYSVAQHSLLVVDICTVFRPQWPPKWKLAALLHDAPEYVIGDLISPFKAAVGIDYKAFEQTLESAIHLRCGLPACLPASISQVIKRADIASAYFEAVHLAGFTPLEAGKIFGTPRRISSVTITPISTREAEKRFLRRFRNLAAEADLLPLPTT